MTATAVAGAESRWPVEHCSAPTCNRPIIWAVTSNRRAIPVDAEPVKGGNVLLREQHGQPEPLAEVVRNPARLFGKTTWRSHFASCPQAEKFRRRGAR